MFFIIAPLIILFSGFSRQSEDIVEIKTNGTVIVGKKLLTLFENKPYGAFWKIPYADPPLKALRFQVYTYIAYIGILCTMCYIVHKCYTNNIFQHRY